MKRAVSFLPAATQMIYDMGLQHLLHGVTFECPVAALAEKPVVVHCVLEGNSYSSEEIDRIFSASKAQGKSLYYTNDDLLEQLQPDVIFTQDVCEVCQIDTKCTLASIQKLSRQPKLVVLNPATLPDVFANALAIATALGHEEAGYTYIAQLQKQLKQVQQTLVSHGLMPVRASLLEWVAPLYNCAHWIPYQIAHAGGIDMLSNPGGDSMVIPWQKIVRYNPEVLVVAPCGFTIGRTLQELHLLEELPGYHQLKAIEDKRLWIMDFDLFTQPSAATLVAGIMLLCAAFHPGVFEVPQAYAHKIINPLLQKNLAYA